VSNSMFVGVQTGIAAQAGSISVENTLFLSNSLAGIQVSGVGKRGLGVTSSLFVKSGSGIAFGSSVKTSDMITIGVSCSRFVAAPLRVPVDCGVNPTSCAEMLRYNTLIAVPNSITAEDRRTLSRGENQYTEATPTDVAGYVQVVLATAAEKQHKFEMDDHHGRVDDVMATVTIVGTDTNWQMMIATHVPVSQKCFAHTLPAGTDPEGPARVVSNLFDLRTNAPTQCVSVALRIQLDNSTDLHDGEDLTVFSVSQLGTKDAVWQQAASHVVEITSGHGSVAVEASSGGGQLMSAVVVAAHANSVETGAGNSASVAAIGRVAASRTTAGARGVPISTTAHAALTNKKSDRQLCVACGNDQIPAYLIAERCSGNTQKNVLTSLDAALLEAQENVATQQQSVSLLVYGSQCVASKCTYSLGSTTARLLIEGVGPDARGSVRRPGSCDAATPFLVARTSGVTLRYLLISSEASVASAIPVCAIQAPASGTTSIDSVQVAFSTVSGGICIGVGRGKTALLGNEISGSSDSGVVVSIAGDGAMIERNSFSMGVVSFSSMSNSFLGNKIFASSRIVVSNSTGAGQVTSAINVYGSRQWNKDLRCVSIDRNSDFVSDSDTYGEACSIALGGTAVQSLRQTLSRTQFTRVQIEAFANVQLSNISLLSSSAVVYARGLENTVYLNNVFLDLSATTVGASLIGVSKRPTNKCALANEALLGGFILSKSIVYDLGTNRRLFTDISTRWPADNQYYVSADDGSLIKCTTTSTSEFCACANPTTASKATTTGKSAIAVGKTPAVVDNDLPPMKRILESVKTTPVPAPARRPAISPKAVQVVPFALTPAQQCAAEACPHVSGFASNAIVSCDFFSVFDIENSVPANQPFCTNVNECTLGGDLNTGSSLTCHAVGCTQEAVNDVFGCTCDSSQPTDVEICACDYTDITNAQFGGVAQCVQPPTPPPPTPPPQSDEQQCDSQACPSIQGFATSTAIGCELFTVFEIESDVESSFSFCSAVSECTTGFDLITHAPYKCQQSACTSTAVANPSPCTCGTQSTVTQICACSYTDITDANVFGIASCVQSTTAAPTPPTTTAPSTGQSPEQQCEAQTVCPTVEGFSTSSAIGCDLFSTSDIESDFDSSDAFCSSTGVCTVGIDLISNAGYTCSQPACTASAVQAQSDCSCVASSETTSTCACSYTSNTDATTFGVAACVQPTTTTTTSPGGTTLPPNTLTFPKNNNNTVGLAVGLGVGLCILICCCIVLCIFCAGLFGSAAVVASDDAAERERLLRQQQQLQQQQQVAATGKPKFNYGLGDNAHHID
jgi:hypothetical protein